MQRWQRLRLQVYQSWQSCQKRRMLIAIVAGLSLIVGIGLGMYRIGPGPVETPVVNPVSHEDLEAAVVSQVQTVIGNLYPWVLDGPVQVVMVEPPENPKPNPIEYRPEPEPVVSFEHLIWPVQGEVSTPFGWYRHPVYGDWRFNGGLEFQTSADQVRTVLAGTVVSVTSTNVDTELVIDHGSGWSSIYRSVRGINVSPGERVSQNQTIALPESTGLVYFGLTHNDEPVNPQAFLR